MAKTTTLVSNPTLATSGPYNQLVLWSNPNNWTNGVPANGDAVDLGTYAGITVDDISGLTSLASLTRSSGYATVYIESPLTIGSVINAGGSRTSFSVFGTLTDNSATNTGSYYAGNYYGIQTGGKVIIAAPPTAEYEYSGAGTLAFKHPNATNSASIIGIAGLKEVFEVPGTTVDKLILSNPGLTVTTDAGSYAFPNFKSSANLNYTTAFDYSTGLEAITFLPATAPKQQDKQTTGPLHDQWVWSDPNNWSHSPANKGVNVVDMCPDSTDDIDNLIIDTLTITVTNVHLRIVRYIEIQYLVVSSNIYIDSDYYVGDTRGGSLVIDSLSGSGAYIAANGGYSITEILGSTDAGENYSVSGGGQLWLEYSLSASSSFTYVSRGTLALFNPGATTTTSISNVRVGDVLELPGSSITGFSYSGSQLTVTTNVSTYTFTNFYLANDVYFLHQFQDSQTGLIGLRFLGTQDHDYGGDGHSDILFRRASDGLAYLFTMNDATVTNGATLSTQVGNNWQIKGIGDFDDNGTSDLLFSYYNSSNPSDPLNGISYITLQSGTTATSGSHVVQQLGSEWSVQGVGDFNGDGKADVLYRRSTDGFLYLDVMNGAAIDFSKSGFTSIEISDLHWQIAGIADFDGDGNADILWRYDNPSNPSDGLNGVVYEWQMNGTSVVSQGLISAQPGSDRWFVAGTGDFDGDGTADILFRYNNSANASDPLNGLTYIDFMYGTTVTSGAPTQWQIDNSWTVAAIGDYSGDARSDLLFQHVGDGATYIWDMNGTATTSGNFTSVQSGPGWNVQNGVLVS